MFLLVFIALAAGHVALKTAAHPSPTKKKKNPPCSSVSPAPIGPNYIRRCYAIRHFTKGDAVKGMSVSGIMVRTNRWNAVAGNEKSSRVFFRVDCTTLVANKKPYHSELETNTFPSSNNYSFLASLWSELHCKAPQIITDDKSNETSHLLVPCWGLILWCHVVLGLDDCNTLKLYIYIYIFFLVSGVIKSILWTMKTPVTDCLIVISARNQMPPSFFTVLFGLISRLITLRRAACQHKQIIIEVGRGRSPLAAQVCHLLTH